MPYESDNIQTDDRAVVTPVLSKVAKTASNESELLPSATKSTDGKLVLRIDDYWYDLTQWKKSHPGGAQILEHLNGKDSTDAFYSLHSKEAIARLQRMNRRPVDPTTVPPTPSEVVAFRKFRLRLEREGWFERSFWWEFMLNFIIYFLAVFGTYMGTHGHPIVAIVCIAIAMQQAGWVGHDYSHGRGDFCFYAGRFIAGMINAFSPTWWSRKHNTHHVYTNYMGLDMDIANDPVFHLFYPDRKFDTPLRRYQHYYFVPVASVLYISWRVQSFSYAWRTRTYSELIPMLCNYAWLLSMPWYVSLGAVYLAGALVAIIVTATHQSEEMYTYEQQQEFDDFNYVKGQFDTTRDAVTRNFIEEWLWGGMQYQLEHHLFPTMPKYRYGRLNPLLKQFAKDNGLSYRDDSVNDILMRNLATLKYYAQDHDVQAKQAKKEVAAPSSCPAKVYADDRHPDYFSLLEAGYD